VRKNPKNQERAKNLSNGQKNAAAQVWGKEDVTGGPLSGILRGDEGTGNVRKGWWVRNGVEAPSKKQTSWKGRAGTGPLRETRHEAKSPDDERMDRKQNTCPMK